MPRPRPKKDINNPYGNPMPFGPYPPCLQDRPHLSLPNVEDALWRGTDEMQPGLVFNQIPDPTLRATFPMPVPNPKDPNAWVSPWFEGAYRYRG